MKTQNEILYYDDINWDTLWQNARKKKSWTSKGSIDWDKKAKSFSERNNKSKYIDLLLEKIPTDETSSVLDIGSGPGTLSIPLAKSCSQVTAIDYSKEMLRILNELAKKNGLLNIRTVLGAWEDDWKSYQVNKHDICIASRSIGVNDLSLALKKINSYARKYVFITDRISPTPFDPDAFAAVGRKFNSGPDYIHTMNALYKLGIHPNVDILELENYTQHRNMNDAIANYEWMFKGLSNQEKQNLTTYLHSQTIKKDTDKLTIKRKTPPRWALIWWKKDI